jgi:hypothetical protein
MTPRSSAATEPSTGAGSATYTDLGTGYYEQWANIHRQVRNRIRAIERHGYKVTIQAIDPQTGELQAAVG